jgi:gamma-glutamylcysteine synthetase
MTNKVTYQVQLDISSEPTNQEVIQFAQEHGCTATLLEQNGPAGGNPLWLFKSDSFDMLSELYTQVMGYGHGFDDDTLKTMFTEV